jgi:hypothetical protein
MTSSPPARSSLASSSAPPLYYNVALQVMDWFTDDVRGMAEVYIADGAPPVCLGSAAAHSDVHIDLPDLAPKHLRFSCFAGQVRVCIHVMAVYMPIFCVCARASVCGCAVARCHSVRYA